MSAAIVIPGTTASTFLTHFFGSGLADDRYVVERIRALANGDIRPLSGEDAAKGKAKTKRVTARLKAVRELRPARTEIFICTGLRPRSGLQVGESVRPERERVPGKDGKARPDREQAVP